MLIGDMDDEGFDNFELVRDLFASSNIMKDQHQTLVDFKDKMLQLQSKSAYSISYTQDGQDMVFHALTEEFYVNLMFHNLTPRRLNTPIQSVVADWARLWD